MDCNVNNNQPWWMKKDTIFYVDWEKRDIFECKITSIIDENTLSVAPVTYKNDKIPKIITAEDIGKDFFWVLHNALLLLGFYSKER